MVGWGYSRYMHRQASKKQTSKHHDRSLDDFVKNLKRYNLKSERYDRLHSPPDPFGPYRNITHTLERSRTLSGKQSRKTNKTTRQRVERMLNGSSLSRQKLKTSTSKLPPKGTVPKAVANPADLISVFSRRIRETEHFLQGRSKMGLMLCRKFLEMLNEIVENMVLNLQLNLEELEKTVLERVQKEIGERAEKRFQAMQRRMAKLERETMRLMEKENYNNNLIYHLRLNNLDVDHEFGKCVFKSEGFGGSGYRDRNGSQEGEEEREDPLVPFSNSELLYVQKDSSGSESIGRGQEWQWSSGRHRKREQP